MTRLGLAAYRASFLLAPLTALTLVRGIEWALADPDRHTWATWWPVILIYGVIPVLDLLFGRVQTSFTPDQRERLSRDRLLRAVPWLCGSAWLGLFAWAFWRLPELMATLPLVSLVGFTVSLGVIGGILAINTGHELVHRTNRFERMLGGILLSSVCYGVFKVEHVLGHHRYVATAADPATARRGESVYAFVPRAVAGVYRQGWKRAAERAARQGYAGWAALLRNEVAQWLGVSVLFGVAAALLSGAAAAALVVFLGMSAVAIAELEVVDYIEHYGLVRQVDASGRVEAVGAQHSWDYSGWLTNAFLLNLQRHSDHHLHAGRPFAALESRPEAPQLPASYSVMILSALLPPLWRALIHPRLDRVILRS
ncbi:MAG: alkane 1-monooxygenase [Casimicrobiaceae bacterium]|nr:alkane 1-monooxygenase [Casimicrobiaceae bacterium]MCX8097903.1 alkane 1-monooxygenase [Casimicrobiaceae bacterium]MDW8313044.1 alkane 1-monooxygenase [Burkholderiales bacterium]